MKTLVNISYLLTVARLPAGHRSIGFLICI